MYLPSAFASILLGFALCYAGDVFSASLIAIAEKRAARIWCDAAVCLLILVMGLSGLGFLRTQSSYWLEASRISKSTLEQCAELVTKSGRVPEHIVLLRPIDKVKHVWMDGAYVFRNGMEEALHHELGPRFAATKIEVIRTPGATPEGMVIDCSSETPRLVSGPQSAL
jgi:hypothetical protein